MQLAYFWVCLIFKLTRIGFFFLLFEINRKLTAFITSKVPIVVANDLISVSSRILNVRYWCLCLSVSWNLRLLVLISLVTNSFSNCLATNNHSYNLTGLIWLIHINYILISRLAKFNFSGLECFDCRKSFAANNLGFVELSATLCFRFLNIAEAFQPKLNRNQ